MGKTILVADDSKTIQKAIQMTFEKTDFSVIAANSGQEALERIPEVRPDIVLADALMPGHDGYQLCTQLKQQATTRGISVILLEGAFEPLDESKARLAEADGSIKKPFETKELIELVEKLSMAAPAAPPASFADALAAQQPPPPTAPRPPPPAPGFAGPATHSPFGAPRAEAPMAPPPPTPMAPPPAPMAPPPAHMPPPPTPMAAPPPPAGFDALEDVPIDDDVVIEDIDMGDDMAAPVGPTLEPPAPPSPTNRPRSNIDVWQLADATENTAAASAQAIAEVDIEDVPVEVADLDQPRPAPSAPAAFSPPPPAPAAFSPPPPAAVPRSTPAALAEHAAPPVAAAAAAATGLPKEELLALAKKTIEEIAWEVVPELAETIIREELGRLLADD